MANILFTEDHEWISVEGGVATVGITIHAQEQLGDLVFVDLPEVGRTVSKGEGIVVVESVKAASDVTLRSMAKWLKLTTPFRVIQLSSIRLQKVKAGCSSSSFPTKASFRDFSTRLVTTNL